MGQKAKEFALTLPFARGNPRKAVGYCAAPGQSVGHLLDAQNEQCDSIGCCVYGQHVNERDFDPAAPSSGLYSREHTAYHL